MPIEDLLIKRLNFLEQIDYEVKRYRNSTGETVPNVSGWGISNDYRNLMMENFDCLPYILKNPIDYAYSYSVNPKIRESIIQKLGGNSNMSVLLVPNNTIALVNVINYVAKFCPNQIGLLLPCYFTIPNLLNNRSLSYIGLSMIRTKNGYRLPIENIRKHNCKVLIITNPVFSTGQYLCEEDIMFLKEFLAQKNCVVCDESLAAPNYELIRDLGEFPYFLSIYSPHKFIHFNSFKFSSILYNRVFEDFFDHWNDVYSGGLNITNIHAINHYLSENYQKLSNIFFDYMNEKSYKVQELVKHFHAFQTDNTVIGDYLCIYSNKIPYQCANNLTFIKKVIHHTKSVFYPGSLHGFQKEHGFVFRINLASYGTDCSNALLKILDYLSNHI